MLLFSAVGSLSPSRRRIHLSPLSSNTLCQTAGARHADEFAYLIGVNHVASGMAHLSTLSANNNRLKTGINEIVRLRFDDLCLEWR